MRALPQRVVSAGIVAALLGAPLFATPSPARATESSETTDSSDIYIGVDSSYSERVEECTTAYREAVDRLNELNGQIDANQARISELNERLPEQRAKAAQSLRTMYKFDQSSNGFLDLVLSANDFNQFIATIQYLDIIQAKNHEEINNLIQLNDELTYAQASLDAEQQEITEQVSIAEQALHDAEEAREAARQASIATSMEEEKRRQAALEEARKHEGETFTTATGREVVVEAPAPTAPAEPVQQEQPQEQQQEQPQEQAQGQQTSTPAPQQPTSTTSTSTRPTTTSTTTTSTTPSSSSTSASSIVNAREKFISTWAPRIDAFNEGYPLAGYGRTFAAAAYDYGVDPRWSPAIARIESSSGLYCFASHNAWGWGDAEWPDWETAITSHVRGLGRGYGYTLTFAAASTYCPPNAELWFSTVDSGMKSIWPNDRL